MATGAARELLCVVVRGVALVVVFGIVAPSSASAAPRLRSVGAEHTDEGTRVLLHTDAPVKDFKAFPLREPDRLVIDLPGAATDLTGTIARIGSAEVSGVRVGAHPGYVRIVIDRPPGQGATPARTEAVAGGLLVTLAAAEQASREPPPSPQEPAVGAGPPRDESAGAEPAGAAPRLVSVSSERTPEGTRVLLRTDAPVERFEPTPLRAPDRLVIDLPDATTGLEDEPLEIATAEVSGVRVGVHPGYVRVVIDRPAGHAPTPARVQRVDGGLLVTLAAASSPSVETPAAEVSAPPPQAVAASVSARAAEPARPLPDGLAYPVSAVALVYAKPHPDLPPLEELGSTRVELGRRADGFVAAQPGVPVDTVSVADLSRAPSGLLYGSAIRSINDALVAELNRRGLVAIRVAPHAEDIDPKTDRDLRSPDRRTLRLVITAGVLLEHRTFASGDRVSPDAAIDNPLHAPITDAAPIQPGDLVWKPRLDAYLARLNRHAGRRVEPTISAATEPGGVYLDYLVAEHRPLTLYAQVGNTGTEETDDWRQRFGLTHTQLTGRDDVLRLDYITANFDEVHASFASYEAPVPGLDRVRWRLGGSWSQYDASELGSGAEFDGKQWDASLEGIVNVFQHESLFVDAVVGVRWLDVSVDNDPIPGFELVSTDGDESFFLPSVGLRLEQLRDVSAFTASLAYEWNVASIANTDRGELSDLGRVLVDDSHFQTLSWDTYASLFVDPYLARVGLGDARTPGARLAHEIAFLTRGQYAFGERLAPQFEQIAGGLYSVRGYPQSLVAGDDVAIGTAEYRLHIPRLLGYRPTPAKLPLLGSFRVAPQQPYGSPDWDFIVRAFVDAAVTGVNDPVPGESDHTLLGAGAGIELRLLRNWIVRLDWGRALRSAGSPPDRQQEGDHEYYFQTTLLW